MPRIRTKPIHPFIQNWMDQNKYSTLKEAAEKSGIAESTLRDWANGKCNFSLDSAELAAKKFGMSVTEWIEGMRSGMAALATSGAA